MDCAALAEVYQPRLEEGIAATGGAAKPYRDFRKLLDDKDVQAVVVCTPDHWHALAAMMACAAGKDVYTEKPMTLFVKEGRWMVDVARKHNRVVQVGTQQRSGKHYQKARELIQAGYIGRIMSIRSGSARNITPGFPVPPDSAPPADFDYGMWLGPARQRPYNHMHCLYHFRWFWDYSGGQMTNLGAHEMDIRPMGHERQGPECRDFQRWPPGAEGWVRDAGYAGRHLGVSGIHGGLLLREAAQGRGGQGGLEFIGDKGTLVINRAGFEILPDMRIDPMSAVPGVRLGSHPAGGPRLDPNFKPSPWIQAMKEPGSSAEQFNLHARNFIDCVKSRQRPISDVEEGHQVNVACHLANISLRTARSVVGPREGRDPWRPRGQRHVGAPLSEAVGHRPAGAAGVKRVDCGTHVAHARVRAPRLRYSGRRAFRDMTTPDLSLILTLPSSTITSDTAVKPEGTEQ